MRPFTWLRECIAPRQTRRAKAAGQSVPFQPWLAVMTTKELVFQKAM
jgi:hypothetical protein